MRDFYRVLGIAATADDKRIKSAFRRRAKAFHPDLNPGDRRAEERFRELTAAYEVLRSAHARACYDACRAQRRSAARRRMAGSAALMAASFMLTLGSAFAVLAVSDAGVPVQEGWQLSKVVERLMQTATSALGRPGGDAWDEARMASIEPASRPATEVTKSGVMRAVPNGPAPVAARAAPPPADAAPPPNKVGGHRPAQEAPLPVRAHRKVAAATHAPAEAERREVITFQPAAVIGEGGHPLPTADEPFMALGATRR